MTTDEVIEYLKSERPIDDAFVNAVCTMMNAMDSQDLWTYIQTVVAATNTGTESRQRLYALNLASAKNPEFLEALAKFHRWKSAQPAPAPRTWTQEHRDFILAEVNGARKTLPNEAELLRRFNEWLQSRGEEPASADELLGDVIGPLDASGDLVTLQAETDGFVNSFYFPRGTKFHFVPEDTMSIGALVAEGCPIPPEVIETGVALADAWRTSRARERAAVNFYRMDDGSWEVRGPGDHRGAAGELVSTLVTGTCQSCGEAVVELTDECLSCGGAP